MAPSILTAGTIWCPLAMTQRMAQNDPKCPPDENKIDYLSSPHYPARHTNTEPRLLNWWKEITYHPIIPPNAQAQCPECSPNEWKITYHYMISLDTPTQCSECPLDQISPPNTPLFFPTQNAYPMRNKSPSTPFSLPTHEHSTQIAHLSPEVISKLSNTFVPHSSNGRGWSNTWHRINGR